MLRIGIVAGEASGDLLAADLIGALRKINPEITFAGIGGPYMQAAGCEILYSAEKLAVMGLIEVAGRYLQLLKVRNQINSYFTSNPPDVFIGIDSPDFNLGLEESLRNSGIKTIHYVSPSVWAWRKKRIKKIKRSTDLMLVLFPFEQEIYEKNGIAFKFIGHPLLDKINHSDDKSLVRKELGLPVENKIVAIMPGSRESEIKKMLPLQLETAYKCNKNRNDLIFITSVLSEQAANFIKKVLHNSQFNDRGIKVQIFINKSKDVLAAADAALLTSGTVTLESMLCNTPMVVAYKVNWITYVILRSMITAEYAALPNLLAGKCIVSEFLQGDCNPENMAIEILRLIDDPQIAKRQIREFDVIRHSLKMDASKNAAEAIITLCNKG